MSNLKFYIVCFLVFFTPLFGAAQNVQSTIKDTVVLGKYKGEIDYQFRIVQGQEIPHGPISFESLLYGRMPEEELKRISFSGRYNEGQKHGVWKFKETNYLVDLNNINERRGAYALDYNLTGKEKELILSFSSGVPVGKWFFNRAIIENNRKKPQINTGEINFKNGLATGKIIYQNAEQGISFTLNLNQEGFLDGETYLSYFDAESQKTINEMRFYEDGFLLRLEKSYEDNRNPFQIVIFDDISRKLDSISKGIDGVNYSISGKSGFGLLFDNGYVSISDSTEKIATQLHGNSIIEDFLQYFDRFLEKGSSSYTSPKYNFTRRIKYAYPKEEVAVLENLQNDLNKLCLTYNEFVNEPRNKLYKAKSKQLSEAMIFISHANKKCDIIDEQIKLLLSDKFSFLYRPNFYISGIQGLNKVDTLHYVFNEDSSFVVFDVGALVQSHDDLVNDMSNYFYKMKAKTAEYKLVAQDKVQVFKEQDDIDSLDKEIVQSQEINDALFGKFEDLKKLNFDQLAFNQKVYFVFQKEVLIDLKDKYLDAKSYTDKKEIGQRLACFNSVLRDEYERLTEIGHKRNSIDSLFTVYEDNPFDNRKFESRILGNIREKAGEVLFRFYIEDLLKTSDCKQVSEKIDKLQKLFLLLEELVATHKSEETVRLNRVVRRESVPNRIERVLGISNDFN